MYYIVKKNTDGVYLLDDRNEVVYMNEDSNSVWLKYLNIICTKSSSNKYVMCSKENGTKYINILCER